MTALNSDGTTAPPIVRAQGNCEAFDQIGPAVYAELKRMARDRLRHERGDITLQPTALVHETYLRLMNDSAVDQRGVSGKINWALLC